MSEFDFRTVVDRENTGSLKWDKYRGKTVLPFWVADMDFISPPAVLKTLHERVEHGVFGYTLARVEDEQAVVDYMVRVHGVSIEREWILWMPGLVPALNAAARAFCEPGEAVLTCTPVYPPFLTAPAYQDCQLQTVPLKWEGERYTFDFVGLEAAVTAETKVFYLCNPHNPGGRVFSESEIRAVVDFCLKHGLVLISDEIHCDLLLSDTVSHVPTLKLGEAAEAITLGLYAPSKTYNVPGLACSFIIIPNAKLRTRFRRAARGMITEVNCFGYAGCTAALNDGEPWRKALIEVLKENYALLYSTVLEQMPKVVLRPMEATYLAWLDVRSLGLADPVGHFEAHGIGLSDGAFFGDPGWVRLNFGCPTAHLRRGLECLLKGYTAALA